MPVKCYRELLVWQKAMDVVVDVYGVTAQFPKTELYGLTSQLRRAAVSIPSNIAEGQGRNTTRDFLHFLSMSQGSLSEVETQVMLARRLQYIEVNTESRLLDKMTEVGRLIGGLRRSLEAKTSQPTTNH